MKQKEFWALDWLRFVLALYLVLYHTLRGHYRAVTPTWIETLLELGNMATSVFFVLSGFLLTHVYVILKDGRDFNKRNFFIGRFSSLVPLHLATFILAFIPFIVTLYVRGGISVPIEPSGHAFRMLDCKEAILATLMNLTLLSAWNPYYLILNSPSWSLSALMCYYLVFPAIAHRIYRTRSLGYGLLILGILFLLPGMIADVLQQNDVFTNGLLHHNPLIRLPLFLSGMALCVIFSRHQELDSKPKYVLPSAWVIFATIAVALYLVSEKIQLHILQNGLYFPAALGAVWICACAKTPARSSVVRWGARLGSASLPMFLIHVPLFQLFTKAEKFLTSILASPSESSLAGIPSSYGTEQAIILFPLYIFPLIAFCIFTQERFVVPAKDKIKRYFFDSAVLSPARNHLVKESGYRVQERQL